PTPTHASSRNVTNPRGTGRYGLYLASSSESLNSSAIRSCRNDRKQHANATPAFVAPGIEKSPEPVGEATPPPPTSPQNHSAPPHSGAPRSAPRPPARKPPPSHTPPPAPASFCALPIPPPPRHLLVRPREVPGGQPRDNRNPPRQEQRPRHLRQRRRLPLPH